MCVGSGRWGFGSRTIVAAIEIRERGQGERRWRVCLGNTLRLKICEYIFVIILNRLNRKFLNVRKEDRIASIRAGIRLILTV